MPPSWGRNKKGKQNIKRGYVLVARETFRFVLRVALPYAVWIPRLSRIPHFTSDFIFPGTLIEERFRMLSILEG
jgi:hypothetical protein